MSFLSRSPVTSTSIDPMVTCQCSPYLTSQAVLNTVVTVSCLKSPSFVFQDVNFVWSSQCFNVSSSSSWTLNISKPQDFVLEHYLMSIHADFQSNLLWSHCLNTIYLLIISKFVSPQPWPVSRMHFFFNILLKIYYFYMISLKTKTKTKSDASLVY